MPSQTPLLAPVSILILWCGVIWAWMYITRIPAIAAARMRLDSLRPRGEQMAELPPTVRWKADNYNHLMEQPPLFYAVAVVLTLQGDHSPLALALAWAYVALRVAHSLVQVTVNHILVRFAMFFISSLVLFTLAGKAALQAF